MSSFIGSTIQKVPYYSKHYFLNMTDYYLAVIKYPTAFHFEPFFRKRKMKISVQTDVRYIMPLLPAYKKPINGNKKYNLY